MNDISSPAANGSSAPATSDDFLQNLGRKITKDVRNENRTFITGDRHRYSGKRCKQDGLFLVPNCDSSLLPSTEINARMITSRSIDRGMDGQTDRKHKFINPIIVLARLEVPQ
jgi:hypothetical protein